MEILINSMVDDEYEHNFKDFTYISINFYALNE